MLKDPTTLKDDFTLDTISTKGMCRLIA
jgi:hypothetical protein